MNESDCAKECIDFQYNMESSTEICTCNFEIATSSKYSLENLKFSCGEEYGSLII